MLNLTIQTKCISERWKKCVSCAVKKDKGSPKLLILCVIYLYEADLNMMMKYLWGKKIVHHAEFHNVLGNDQFGSRTYKACIDIVLQKMLTMTHSRQTKTDIIVLDSHTLHYHSYSCCCDEGSTKIAPGSFLEEYERCIHLASRVSCDTSHVQILCWVSPWPKTLHAVALCTSQIPF